MAGVLQVNPEKENDMTYMKLGEFPEPIRLLIQKLPQQGRNRILHPHVDATRSRQLQETMIQVLEASISEGESEESMLDRLSQYANTEWL